MTKRLATLPFLLPLLMMGSTIIPRGASAGLMMVALVSLVCLWPVRDQLDWRQTGQKLKWPWITFAAFAISAFFSPSTRALEMLRDSFFVMGAVTILFAGLTLWPQQVRQRALICIVVGFVLAYVYYVSQFTLNFPLDRAFGHKPPEFDIFNTNIPKRGAALLLLLAWPAVAVLALRGKQVWAVGLMTIVAFTLPDFVSRAAMLGGLAGWAALLLTFASRRAGALIGFIALPLSIPLTLLMSSLLPFLVPLVDQLLPHSGWERLKIWQQAFAAGAVAWPFGIGLDGSRIFTPEIPIHPHNIFLQIFLEGGLWGVGLITLLFGMVWAQMRRADPRLQPYLWGFTVSAVTVGAIAYGLWQGWWLAAYGMAGFMLALVASVSRPAASAPDAVDKYK